LAPWITPVMLLPILRLDLGPFSPGGVFARRLRRVHDLVDEEIALRRESGAAKDALGALLKATDEDGQPLGDEQLRIQTLSLLFAGYETTASALAWAAVWLTREPQVRNRLRAELGPGRLVAKSLATNAYLNAVTQETLRMSPILSTVTRTVRGPFSLRGIPLPEGTIVAPCVYLTHRRPDLYREPAMFMPERFLERKFSGVEFLPFGGGPRHCLGWALALLELKIGIAWLARHYRFSLLDDDPTRVTSRGGFSSPRLGGRVRIAEAPSRPLRAARGGDS
jgi:cytochrome P450